MDRDTRNLLTGLGIASASNYSVLAFVVSAYFTVLLLFWFLQLHMRASPNSDRRKQLKAAIWSLATFLTGMFAYKVAALMPWPVALVVWAMAAAMIIGGFYDFVIYPS